MWLNIFDGGCSHQKLAINNQNLQRCRWRKLGQTGTSIIADVQLNEFLTKNGRGSHHLN
ncbi:hypothetical protein DY78_GL003007 [Lactiplantibacillus fabifermentans DSM 21115]|uniref:Uncharacterized protein n=1 Tax=Lactiplantibacillus fabifermentans DSM 21115 TaxID=1413187 RepID=A0A0R2NV19_9LACO|nr:hypothetical protein DY78_GL003007 [Lactiplantibacillus fabifermentans DSM 21115]